MLNQSVRLIAPLKALSWRALAHRIGVGALAGMISGLLAGIGARIAMRIVAVASESPVEFTVEGTVGILIIGVLISVFPGILYALVSGYLPGPWAIHGLLFGLALLVMIGLRFLFGIEGSELARGPLDLGRGLFAGLFLAYGLALGFVTNWLAPYIPMLRRSPGVVIGYCALTLMGLLSSVIVTLLIIQLYFIAGGASS